MPWIITTDEATFTAATISAEENIITETTIAGPVAEHRSPVIHLSAVIIHTPDGQKTPVQGYTLCGPGPHEITWTSEAIDLSADHFHYHEADETCGGCADTGEDA